MPRNVKKWSIIFLIASLIGIGILAWPSIQWMHKNVTAISKRHDSNMSPVIFIPGSSATQNRFDGLIDKLNDRRGKRHSLLKVTVHTNDRISYSGSIRPRDNEPFIVVGFENNKDGYSNIKKQAKWFSIAFNALAKKYQFNNFKAIGHSNGGLVYTMYLENYFNRDDISIKKLMTIGSPYNFSETSLSHKTQMLSDFIKQRKKFLKRCQSIQLLVLRILIMMGLYQHGAQKRVNIFIRAKPNIILKLQLQEMMLNILTYHKINKSLI